jgi:uncharacterized protein (TIRG00374 family)
MLYSVRDALYEALQHVIPVYLIFAIITCLAAWVIRGLRYQSILSSLQIKTSLAYSTACIFVSQTANLIVPARLGDFIRVLILKHEKGATYSEGVSSLVVERVFDIVTVALLGIVSLPFILMNVMPEDFNYIMLPLIAGGIIGIIFIAVLLISGKLDSQNRYIKIILTMLDEVKRASLTLQAFLFLSISSIIIWILDICVCMFIIMMFEENVPFTIIILAIVIGNLVKAIPLTPGGLGTYEAALAYILIKLGGVIPAVATLIAVIDHLVKNVVTLVGGAISIYFFGSWVLTIIKSAVTMQLRGKSDGGN